MMNKSFFTLLFLTITTTISAQYNNKDGNRIGLTGGVSQSTLFTSNFTSKPGIGFNGGLSVRGNYYNNWSMIFGMQFFINKFSLETTTTSSLKKDTEYSLSGAQVRLLLSYNVVKDHVSLDFGPVLQVNGKMTVQDVDNKNVIKGTLLQADQILDVTKINGNFYLGLSAGSKKVRGVIFYQYGVNNILNNLNKDTTLKVLNGNKDFKGNIGTVSAQILFNL
ncbi:PorT family protein [Flavobacterium sp.]|uniref:PorT family protein n=1 Tax=Flavobacterium sp. TaxID=239 RepID=UPI003751038C